MKSLKFFFIWQDDKEEAWLNGLSLKGQRLDSVSFPFTYHFSSDASKKYIHHLNAPKGPETSLEAFKDTFQKSGWKHIGRMNGWHYFQKEVASGDEPVLGLGKKNKADRYQGYMMVLVGLLPFLLIIFPAVGRRFAPPLFDVLRIAYFLFLALYTLTTFKVYQRVNQLRDNL
jgi:hypothetical protein